MPSKTLFAAIAAIMFMTQGCSFIPEYRQPDLAVEATWSGRTDPADPLDAKAGGPSALASDIAWQDYFGSETLKQLIQLTLDNNRDLRVAVLTIEKARAAYRIQRADSLPVVSAGTGVSRQGVAEDNSSTGAAYTSDTTMTANLGVTAYELDFFGRVRSLNTAALETYLATEEAALNTRIALIGQTADAYMTLLADRKLLELSQSTFQAQKETYEVIKSQFEVGSATQLDLAQAATSVESARVSIAQYTRLAAQAENAVTLLAGTSVYSLLNSGETIDDIRFMDGLPAGLPSQVLLARPDIRSAEHKLKAANADIGAARAALYPSISLTGSMGFASQSLTSLFDVSDSLAWSFAPSLTIPIFNRDGLNASLETAEISEKIAVASYEGTVQTAFREVADQLAARKTYQDQLKAQNALVDATQESYTLSRARYENGIDDFLAVLDSQRALFSAQQGAITVRQSYLSNLVNLYKVLGGGQL
ncbi:efflux transporter outer membrane subunit [Desulfospira joergensenii]|uniref:efflux transporter outer membrane subunit n=1 Tax=Desulfospira joergensenii TaxID=53329 RepID=UPI0003B3C634|nr:efflux transporter outer membrane subunit [Desulfospira joergensenii]